MGTPCILEPLLLPIRDVQINSTVPDSFMRGIPARIGNPEQEIVLLPWPELNNTWVYDEQAFCDPTRIFSDEICFVRRGRYYLESDSSTFKQALDIVDAGGASSETGVIGSEPGISSLVSSGLGGTDIFTLGFNRPLEEFPFGIPRQGWDSGYTTLHALGFGSNSTFLNALVDAKQIGARVWSIFWGRMWAARVPMDGSIVLGGYDRAKVIGKNLTQALDFGPSGCWTGMNLNVRDIRVNFRTGSDQSLLPTNTVLSMCLVPQRQLLFEAPSSIFATFENITRTKNIGLSFGLHWGAGLFDTGTEFDGDITFELDAGLAIRVPNDQYVVPFVTIERNSSRIFNESQREVLIGALGDQPATLGRYFLTAAYLMVDHDAGTFTIWQANPSESVDLAAVADQQITPTCNNTLPPVQTQTTATSSGEAGKTGLSGGGIAGIAISLLAVLATVGLYVFFLRRRKRYSSVAIPVQQSTGPQEMHGDLLLKPFIPQKPMDLGSAREGGTMSSGQRMQEMEAPSKPMYMYELEGHG